MRNIFTTMAGNGCVRKCLKCKTDENVEFSDHFDCYICDDCYEEMIANENDDRIG